MEYINKNVDILSKNPNNWIGDLKESSLSLKFLNKNEEGNELFLLGDKIISIKNEFDQTQRPNDLKRELIFVIGINSLYEINKLSQVMSKESFLVIIEPNVSFLNHVLHNKDLSIFNSLNVILFADDLINLPFFLDNLYSTSLIYYLKNIRFYFTSYYRNHSLDSCTLIINKVKETVKYKTMVYGNSIEDSLTGFKHNMRNIKQLVHSKDVSLLKDLFINMPAVVVAAGPSLNKNIEQLKKMQGKAIIIAVDTIASRLCNEGIIPDFICSIEREKETYTYFYQEKKYPQETTLVGPLLLYPKIFEEFNGNVIIPMRKNVGEYIWLQDILGLSGDNNISIGLSCAHVAFGFAVHIGASPIILVGQDLAFGSSKEESHAGGTIYDDKNFTNEVFSEINEISVEGYYGEPVRSTDIWVSFRKWFEKEILENKLFVINATEGGAKIANTVQKSLEEVIKEYGARDNSLVKDVLENINNYPLTEELITLALKKEYDNFQILKTKFEDQLKNVERLKINNHATDQELLRILRKLEMTNPLFGQIQGNWLLRHNLQPILMTAIWNLYEIEQVLTASNLKANKEIQVEFLTVGLFVLNKIILLLEDSIDSIKKES